MAEMLISCALRCILIGYLDMRYYLGMRVMAEMLISCALRRILICYLGMRVYG